MKTYLHFGTLPESGRSVSWIFTMEFQGGQLDDERLTALTDYGYLVDHDSLTIYEPGLSCFAIDDEKSTDGELTLCIHAVRMGTIRELIQDRSDHAYLVSGEELEQVGYDSEPLLKDAEVIERVEVTGYGRRGITVVRIPTPVSA